MGGVIAVLVIGSTLGYILVGMIVGSINQACSRNSFDQDASAFGIGVATWPLLVAFFLLFMCFVGPCKLVYRSGRYLSGAMRDTALVRMIKNL